MSELASQRFEQAAGNIRAAGERLAGRVAGAADLVVQALRAGGGVYLFGNGGSAADAQHIAGELVGKFLMDRQGFRAEALTTDTSVLTAVANDSSYTEVFARQLRAKGRAGDVAIGLTTSGNSPNIVAALEAAREIGMRTVAFTGPGGGKCAAAADVLIEAPGENSPRIQEAHAVAYHTLCELVEREMAS